MGVLESKAEKPHLTQNSGKQELNYLLLQYTLLLSICATITLLESFQFMGVNVVLVSTITPVYDFVCFLPYWERRQSQQHQKQKKQRVVKVRKSPRLNHVLSNTQTTPKAPNPINVQLRKSPRLHPTPTVPMKAKKLLFGHLPKVVSNVEAEVRVEPQLTAEDVIKDWTTVIDSGMAFEELVDNEVEDGGASEDDEVDMFIQVGVEYGPSIKLTTGYISEPSSDEEDIDFMPNLKTRVTMMMKYMIWWMSNWI
ncbi:hypothetical protein IFM89_029313 [Coptis chinensis]|uniref:Uncharacterized protein n=1 Tax=Coptis chinensis TaxID=261450 RepID=A0A835MCH2_9MAGN|nr:hypothetical protein IFM89_029313 [Coptis chinensis]